LSQLAYIRKAPVKYILKYISHVKFALRENAYTSLHLGTSLHE